MAIEEKRGCGYRKIGGLYMVGGAVGLGCDRLPMKLEACPVCGAGIHFTRSMTLIYPLDLFNPHDTDEVICQCEKRPCRVCDPTEDIAYVMNVGVQHYPTKEHFIEEANRMGVSKRIPFIPKHLKLSETIIYLAHPKACTVPVPTEDDPESLQHRMLDSQKTGYALGIFMAFVPLRIEMPIYKKNLTKQKRAELKKRGITPIAIPTGDKDHE